MAYLLPDSIFADPNYPNRLTRGTRMTERSFKVIMNRYCRKNQIKYEFTEYSHTIENIPVQFDPKLDYVNLYFRSGDYNHFSLVSVPFFSPANLIMRIRDFKYRLSNVPMRKENCPPASPSEIDAHRVRVSAIINNSDRSKKSA